MSEYQHTIRSGTGPSQTALWVIAILLASVATALWVRPGDGPLPTALAQGQALAGARGIFAFTGPLSRDQYGLFMLDVDQGTLWCYAFETAGGTSKLRLVAARTWIYDRYLQDFNCAAPDFRMVQQLVSQQRAQTGSEGASGRPADAPGSSPRDATPPEK
jgi:hypothetical protein